MGHLEFSQFLQLASYYVPTTEHRTLFSLLWTPDSRLQTLDSIRDHLNIALKLVIVPEFNRVLHVDPVGVAAHQ